MNETGFTVQWDPSIGVVDGYFVSLASSAQPNDIKVAPTDPLKATFLNLSPATSYVVSAVAFRANFSSAPVYLNVTTRKLQGSYNTVFHVTYGAVCPPTGYATFLRSNRIAVS